MLLLNKGNRTVNIDVTLTVDSYHAVDLSGLPIAYISDLPKNCVTLKDSDLEKIYKNMKFTVQDLIENESKKNEVVENENK